jgi:hypothetical protein
MGGMVIADLTQLERHDLVHVSFLLFLEEELEEL